MSKKFQARIGLVIGLTLAGVAGGAEWEPKTASTMTRWAKDVNPKKVLPEYPRPQMARERWLNLNGVWEMAEGKGGETPAFGKGLDGRVLVPFPVESALSGVMRQMQRVTYRRTFAVPGDWAGQRVLLHFGAVDWESTVYVNGKEMGTHRGGYDPFSYDVTDALKEGGENELVVSVFDPSDAGDQPRGKQVREPRGIWYTPTTGIWQTVWLEPVPQGYVKEVKIVPDVDAKNVRVTADAQGEVKIRVLKEGRVVAEGSGQGGKEIVAKVDAPRLWSHEDPFLYDLEVTAGKDAVKSYFGMRKVEVGKDDKGVTRILLNGKPVFQVGMLDQGFWPDGLYTAPTDEALRYDIEIQKKLGFNMIRKHVKVEPARWYYWTDKLGMLVWQDMPSAGNKGDEKKEGESKTQFERELTRMIKTHWNHPSIIMWVVFNEAWGQYETPRITKMTKDLDSTRLASNASGWTDMGVGDIIDMHNYPGPGAPKWEEKRAAVLGEFGGLGLPIKGKEWKGVKEFSYAGQGSVDELVEQYTRLLSKCWQLRETDGLSAVVYTQTTDVEGEINGLLTYDREMIKGDVEKYRIANTGQGPYIETQVVVPSAEKRAIEWRYTTEKPGDDWAKEGFDDSAWKRGPAGFGTGNVPAGEIRTKWETPDLWMRREIEIPAGVDAKDLKLWLHHDDGCEVYLNGALAKARRNSVAGYEEQPLNKEAAAALKPGKNVLAIHGNNKGGHAFLDAGMLRVIERKDRTAAGKE
jgi:hypothetical protein